MVWLGLYQLQIHHQRITCLFDCLHAIDKFVTVKSIQNTQNFLLLNSGISKLLHIVEMLNSLPFVYSMNSKCIQAR